MRTTIDLPDDLHRQAQSLARDTSRTLPVVRLGKVITSVDVRPPEDDSQ